MFLSGEKIEGERCMSAEGSSIKGCSQQSSTSFPKVKGGGPLFSGWGPLITGGLVNDTTPETSVTFNTFDSRKSKFHNEVTFKVNYCSSFHGQFPVRHYLRKLYPIRLYI